MRPRLSQTPRRIVSISVVDFSGNAAVKLARPIRFSGNNGPTVRMNQPAIFRIVSGLVRRNSFSRPIAPAPTAELAARLVARLRRRTIRLIADASKLHNDFAEYLAAFQARQAVLKICQFNFGIDDRGHPGSDFRQTIAYIAHRSAKRTKNLVLLLKQLHQVDRYCWACGRTAGHKTSAALQAEQGAVEAFTADVLENDVDALFPGQLAGDAFKAFRLVIDHMIGSESLGFFSLRVIAHSGDNGAAKRSRHLNGDRTDTGAAGMHQNCFSGFKLSVVEQHVLDGAECNRRAGRVT